MAVRCAPWTILAIRARTVPMDIGARIVDSAYQRKRDAITIMTVVTRKMKNIANNYATRQEPVGTMVVKATLAISIDTECFVMETC